MGNPMTTLTREFACVHVYVSGHESAYRNPQILHHVCAYVDVCMRMFMCIDMYTYNLRRTFLKCIDINIDIDIYVPIDMYEPNS